MHADKSLN